MNSIAQVLIAVVLGFAACGAYAWQSTPDAGVYGTTGSMMLGSVYEGTVVQVRPVQIESSNTATWTGRATGAALGGLFGSRVGQGNGRIGAEILGAALGGVAGDYVTDRVAGYNGAEIVVAMKDHRLVSITQAGAASFAPGEPVYVIQSGGTTRVVARETGQAVQYIQR